MTQGKLYITLQEVILGRFQINSAQFEALRQLLAHNLRAEWKKNRVRNLTFDQLRATPQHWSFARVAFYPNGKVEYIPGQDYNSEFREFQSAIIGKQ